MKTGKKTKTRLRFDEIHKLEPDYFEPMAISIDDKERRRELADFLTDAFLYFFSVYEVHLQYNNLLQRDLYEQLLAEKVSDAVLQVTGIDAYMSEHIKELSKDVVNTTLKYTSREKKEILKSDIDKARKIVSPEPPDVLYSSILLTSKTDMIKPLNDFLVMSGGSLKTDQTNQTNQTESESEYWLSYRRAEDIAKTETNTFLNYTDYVEAKRAGATKKTWLTMLDKKVRNTHEEVEGQTIGIDESFVVGNSLMKFPHDLSESPDPKEIINCRCAVEYSK